MKLIIASLIVFSIIILFLFALFPSEISVTRMLQIRSSLPAVRKKIADLREWKSWNEFILNVPSIRNTDETTVSVDSVLLNAVSFSVKLVKSLPDTVSTQWRRGGKMFTGNFYLSEDAGWTVVEWRLNFRISWYPWDKLASMLYEKQLGPEMEKSLSNLQKELETPVHQ